MGPRPHSWEPSPCGCSVQMRQMSCQMMWSHAVRAFMLGYAAKIAFATCKALGLADEKTTMCEFQWDLVK